MDNKEFLFAKDIESILGIKQSKAYDIINMLNVELETKGLLTLKGRVLAKYFKQRFGIA